MFHLQAEACEAGLEPRILQEWLAEVEGRSEDALTDLLKKEVQKWSQNCVDVDVLQKRLARAEETCSILGNKVALLKDQLEKLQIEKRNGYNLVEKNPRTLSDGQETQRLSSNNEDEGISSSERSSSPEDLHQRQIKIQSIDADQETTIDDVIEELRIIVKDAEEQDRKGQENPSTSCNKNTTKLSSNKGYISNNDNSKIIKESLPNILDSRQIPIPHCDQESIASDQIRLPNIQTKTTIDNGSLKIVIKGAEVEEAIIPAILYPQPPRRTPPCLSNILTTRPDEFLERPIIYNPPDDEDAEEETLGDGSDSLLSASRLKYHAKDNIDLEGRLYLGKNGVTTRESFGNAEQKKDNRKTIRNFDPAIKNLQDLDQSRHLDVYRQFEPVVKANERNRYKIEVEKRKQLRRSVSHDYLDTKNNNDNQLKKGNKIEGKIRKFESMNSFDNSSLQNLTRNNSSHIGNRRRNTDDRKIRRSESCHQVSHSARKENFNQGGSDSGLYYITDYDLEPIVGRRLRTDDPETTNQLAKSLDRIDEGLDSLVDIVIGGSKHWSQNTRSTKEKNIKTRLDDNMIKNNNNNNNSNKLNPSKRYSTRGESKNKRSDEPINNALLYNSSVLKNDELYQADRSQRNIIHQNQMSSFGKVSNFTTDNNSGIISSFNYEKTSSKFLINDSGIFLSSTKPYDGFGLGKNRFNAGKYSGNPPPENIGLRRNSVSSSAAKRGKVTDILSGLY